MARKDISDMQVLTAYICSRHSYKIKSSLDWLIELTGECEKVCYLAMERAKKRKLIDYGVSLRSGWITDTGWRVFYKYNTNLDFKIGYDNRKSLGID